MGASGSLEHKSTSSKTNSPTGTLSVAQPRRNEMLTVVTPPTSSSTPSSPNRHASLCRNRSRSFNAGLPGTIAAGKVGEADDDSGNESIAFSLAELACYCSTDHQHCCHEDNQLPRGERTCKSRDYDDVTSTTAETSIQPSTIASTKSDSQQPNHRVNSDVATHAKTQPRLGDRHTGRPSEAITDITQAKTVTHRAVVARRLQTTSDLTADCKMAQRRLQNKQSTAVAATTLESNGTTVDEETKLYTSSKSVRVTKQSTGTASSSSGSRKKERSTSEAEQTTRSPEAACDDTHDKKEKQSVAVDWSTGTSKAAVRSRSATSDAPPVSTAKRSTSTRSEKSVPQKAEPSQPATSVCATTADDDDDDDDDDLENLITALRDPDDVRHRKTEPRRPSGWNLWVTKLAKPAKDEKQTATQDNGQLGQVNDVCILIRKTINELFRPPDIV